MPNGPKRHRAMPTAAHAAVAGERNTSGISKPGVQPLQKTASVKQDGEGFSSDPHHGPDKSAANPAQRKNEIKPFQLKPDKTEAPQQSGAGAVAQMKWGVSGAGAIRFEGSPMGAAGKGVAQLTIIYNKSAGKYDKKGSRAGWHTRTNESLIKEYNERRGTSLTSIDYKKEKLTRDHIGSFDGLQQYIVDYLNGDLSDGGFASFVDTFIAAIDKSSEEYTDIKKSQGALKIAKGSGTVEDILDDANKLLSLLNNLSANLRAADKYLNSYVQERPDLVFKRTQGGGLSLDEQSRNVLALGSSRFGSIPLTPDHGQRVVTSQGAVPRVDLTPTSSAAVESYPHVKVPIKSDNVRSRLYGPSAHSYFGGAPSTPKPKINLGGSAPAPQVFAPPLLPALPPPPRYTLIGAKIFTYQDGSTVYKASDSQFGNALTFLRMATNGTTVLQDLGPFWTPPPRYNLVGTALYTYQDGSKVYKAADTHAGNAITHVQVNAAGTGVLQDLGASWTPPPRYNLIGTAIVSYQDGSGVFKASDTHFGNTVTYLWVHANGSSVLKDLGPFWTPPPPPPRYTTIGATQYADQYGRTVVLALDTHTNSTTYLFLASDGKTVLNDLGPNWGKPQPGPSVFGGGTHSSS